MGVEQGERGTWLRFRPELATRVELRSDVGTQFAWVRNLSRRGVLLQVVEAPGLGSHVEVTFPAWERTLSASKPFVLSGHVQHALAWTVVSGPFRLIAVRWGPPRVAVARPSQ